MKHIILTILIITTLYSNDHTKASIIFNILAKEITKKIEPNIYLHLTNNSIQHNPGNLNIVTECSNADLVILSTISEIPEECSNKILFGTRYSHLKNPNVIGSFFWQKGRPNILFYEKRLQKNNIKLDPSFNKYIEE